MNKQKPDLKKEQAASSARPRYPYSLAARFFFSFMDLVTGNKITLSKTKLVEILASIPYRAWENNKYSRMTCNYRNLEAVEHARRVVEWGREAQDNEYGHLLVIQEKMKLDGVSDSWYLRPPVPWAIVCFYRIFASTLAFFSLRRAFLFNAEFEDHAEHVYAQFVSEHPEWESQPVDNDLVKHYYPDAATWADVFRRIGLDERDHRNKSFAYCGKPEHVVEYEGMPEID
ncbi:hypothetical protein JW992_10025 [candidate division KSB1 bacterium]|nr:hypothetical protein [candidate division KSB1 bacterium]